VSILVAIVLAAAVALVAWRLRALTVSGAVAAAIVGAVVFLCGAWAYAAVLFAFFLPSVALSRFGRARKRALTDIGKHGPRDARQVLANGGVAAACALLSLRFPHAAAAFAGAFAAASADTWATEIGTLAKQKPRSIWTLQPLETGLSGGITVAGTFAQLGGALAVGAVAAAVGAGNIAIVALAGFAGATADSLVGATLQALRYCPACGRDCETNPHACGTPTVVKRGLKRMDNDAVNFVATATGAAVAFALTR